VFERFHLPAIARVPAISLLAGCDTNRSRLAWAEHWSSPPALFGAPAELLGCPGLEAVLVLTPPASHALNVIQALEAGLHVLVEKPMALDPGEARQMAEAAHLARRHLQVGFSRRFREPYQKLRKALQREEPLRLRRVRFELAFPVASWNAESDFLGKESHGGGVLDDVLSHQVDLVC
jgi:predicted dehydrogenase